MSRNIVPRVNKGADLGTPIKNWNRIYTDAVTLRGNDLQSILNSKTNLATLLAKGDLYVATDAGVITRLPRGQDGYILTTNSLKTEGLEWVSADIKQPLLSHIYVSVGSGGDYETINQAIENITALYTPKYKSLIGVSQSSEDYHLEISIFPKVSIRLLPGFVMSEQVLINALDLSWITIEGDDDETIVNRSAMTKSDIAGRPCVFGVDGGGVLPIIKQLFRIDTSSSSQVNGIVATASSIAIVAPNCGIKDASHIGLYALSGATIAADATIFSGAGMYGIYAERGSKISAYRSTATNATSIGIFATEGSMINAREANASNSAGDCFRAVGGSVINAEGANGSISGFDNYGFRVMSGAIINANGSTGSTSPAPNTLTSNGIIFKEV